MRHWLLSLLAACLVVASSEAVEADRFDQKHSLLDRVLHDHVRNGLVHYRALVTNSAALDQYLSAVAGVRREEFMAWDEPDRLAFLINAYNAFTLRLILDHYPVGSIKDIGWILKGPWDREMVRLFGGVMTLNHLEHEILRKDYREPRIHFAIVCAAKGCPPLRGEAYTGRSLENQLEDQAHRFLGDARKNRFEVKTATLYLSPIFKWFREDFEKGGSDLVGFVKTYLPPSTSRAMTEIQPQIQYTDYDWSLNEHRE